MLGILRKQRQNHARRTQELWRLHGPTRVAVAVLHSDTPVPELRVFFEPESLKDLLAREVGDERTLLAHAEFVRAELLNRGWVELGASGATPPPNSFSSTTRVAAGVSVLATMAALWSWRRWYVPARDQRARQDRPGADQLGHPPGTPLRDDIIPAAEADH